MLYLFLGLFIPILSSKKHRYKMPIFVPRYA
nr:MAG TPA: hypothetical protein [Caudoviricetes sp.]